MRGMDENPYKSPLPTGKPIIERRSIGTAAQKGAVIGAIIFDGP
jgi:hypothetical protein